MDLLIVGAGALGREIYSWLAEDLKHKKNIQIKGFLDEKLNALDNYTYPVKVINRISSYEPKPNEKLVIAIMDPTTKKNIVELLKKKNASFYTAIHHTAFIGNNVTIGAGCIISQYCILTCDITLNDFVFINSTTCIGHDVEVEKYTSINVHVCISGHCKIGEECLFGVGAKVIPTRKIGNKTTIGAGSIVIQHTLPNTTIFGNPAKKISK